MSSLSSARTRLASAYLYTYASAALLAAAVLVAVCLYIARTIISLERTANEKEGFESSPGVRQGLHYRLYTQGFFYGGVEGFFKDKSATEHATATQFSNLTQATVGRGAPEQKSGFSMQWTGYFEPRSTGFYSCMLKSKGPSYLWLGRAAEGDYTEQGALLSSDEGIAKSASVYLDQTPSDGGGGSDNKKKCYFVRVAYGRKGSAGGEGSMSKTGSSLEFDVGGGKGMLNTDLPDGAVAEASERVMVRGLWYVVSKDRYYDGDTSHFDDDLPGTAQGYVTSVTSPSESTEKEVQGGENDVSVSVQWLGAFLARTSGYHLFRLSSDARCYFWLGEHAESGYVEKRALMRTGKSQGEEEVQDTLRVYLEKDTYYPLRLQYGRKKGKKGGHRVRLTFTVPIEGEKGKDKKEREEGDGQLHYFSHPSSTGSAAAREVSHAKIIPVLPGPYLRSCRNVGMTSRTVYAECDGPDGKPHRRSGVALTLDGSTGKIGCKKEAPLEASDPPRTYAPPGSYKESCSNMRTAPDAFVADCEYEDKSKDKKGKRRSGIRLINDGGELGCESVEVEDHGW